jgi:predicted metal-binding membrane protein
LSATRESALAWLALGGATLLAWRATWQESAAMAAMPGCSGAGTMGLGFAPFLAMWSAMMAAMMLPAAAPIAVLWLRLVRRSEPRAGVRLARLLAVVLGYLAVWSAAGGLAWAGLLGIERLVARAPAAAPWLATGLFGAAGAFQLTPWKDRCLDHCRSPVTHLVHYTAWRGPLRDLRVGLHHGAWCLACCAGLMVIRACVGVMNLPAMVAVAAVVVGERTLAFGVGLSRAVGALLLVAAIAAPFAPQLRPGLAPDPVLASEAPPTEVRP